MHEARVNTRLAWLGVILLCGIGAVVGWLWLVFAALYDPKGDRAWQLAAAFGRVGNAAAGGSPRMGLSVHAGMVLEQREEAGRFPPRWAFWLCRLLHKLDPDHCAKSWETFQKHNPEWPH